jgi:hypothetical protein
MVRFSVLAFICLLNIHAASGADGNPKLEVRELQPNGFAIHRAGQEQPLIVQNAAPDFRPHIHPIMAPDGSGVLTLRPEKNYVHHCGLWFGLNKVNGKNDFFYKNDSFHPLPLKTPVVDGNRVTWTVEDDWQAVRSKPFLRETQEWAFTDHGTEYVLDLTWHAKAYEDITFGKADYGGLFVKLADGGTFRSGDKPEAVKAAELESTRSRWMSLENKGKFRDGKPAVVVIMDHDKNHNHPTPWRVTGDHFGTSPCKLFESTLKSGDTTSAKYRIVVSSGKFDAEKIEARWKEFVTDKRPSKGK